MINISRRGFIERAGRLAVAGTATPFVLSLAAAGEAAAATAPDYKALVCIHLAGGNDYANTLIPADPGRYADYARLRQGLALSSDSIAATTMWTPDPNAALPGGQQYALAPGLAPLLPVWNAGRMAAILNVGTLVQPVIKAQYTSRNVPLPPKLFSHNDQRVIGWQATRKERTADGVVAWATCCRAATVTPHSPVSTPAAALYSSRAIVRCNIRSRRTVRWCSTITRPRCSARPRSATRYGRC